MNEVHKYSLCAYLAHVPEVEDIDRDTQDSIHHHSYLPICSAGYSVTVPAECLISLVHKELCVMSKQMK